MNRADERRAFEAMLAEVEDSDEDDYSPAVNNIAPSRGNTWHVGSSDKGGGYYSGSSRKSSSPPRNNRTDAGYFHADSKQDNSKMAAAAKSEPVHRRPPPKMSKEEQEIQNFGSDALQTPAEIKADQINNTKRWLMRPCNPADRFAMKCFVERERLNLGLHVIYRCYVEGTDGSLPRFMMSAKKKMNKQTSYYLLSLDDSPDDDRGSDSVIGKVRGNSVGSKVCFLAINLNTRGLI